MWETDYKQTSFKDPQVVEKWINKRFMDLTTKSLKSDSLQLSMRDSKKLNNV